jgi:hypothetical protein
MVVLTIFIPPCKLNNNKSKGEIVWECFVINVKKRQETPDVM